MGRVRRAQCNVAETLRAIAVSEAAHSHGEKMQAGKDRDVAWTRARGGGGARRETPEEELNLRPASGGWERGKYMRRGGRHPPSLSPSLRCDPLPQRRPPPPYPTSPLVYCFRCFVFSPEGGRTMLRLTSDHFPVCKSPPPSLYVSLHSSTPPPPISSLTAP